MFDNADRWTRVSPWGYSLVKSSVIENTIVIDRFALSMIPQLGGGSTAAQWQLNGGWAAAWRGSTVGSSGGR
ncbi:hypothetical protein JQK87_07325 [Streptomyces sp. G44]|uniref:hypothetical protein n=1 Tax=Streptomyces sp. G44 TaxID=2807632 RepID=UPI0019613BAC|nr:hypothetical protein [Streptomyces sp. G44]MBM7168222.1 hypothetical protein [Streptomyces sp. G44]